MTTYFTIVNKLTAVRKTLSMQIYKIEHFLVLIGFILPCLIDKCSLSRFKSVLLFKNILFLIALLAKISKNVAFSTQQNS